MSGLKVASGCLVWIALYFVLASASVVHAGPHEYGVFFPHVNPELTYSYGGEYAGMADLRNCEKARTDGRVDGDEPQIWYLMASFAASPGPVHLSGACFGIADYDPGKIYLADWGSCGCIPIEMETSGWPGPHEGTCVVFDFPKPTSEVVEIYWFAAYAYEPATLELGVNPQREFASVTAQPIPPSVAVLEDEIFEFGILGFGEEGYNPCAVGTVEGACCVWPECVIATRGDCEIMDGSYMGDNSTCFPDPCGFDEGAEISWGNVKKLFREF